MSKRYKIQRRFRRQTRASSHMVVLMHILVKRIDCRDAAGNLTGRFSWHKGQAVLLGSSKTTQGCVTIVYRDGSRSHRCSTLACRIHPTVLKSNCI